MPYQHITDAMKPTIVWALTLISGAGAVVDSINGYLALIAGVLAIIYSLYLISEKEWNRRDRNKANRLKMSDIYKGFKNENKD